MSKPKLTKMAWNITKLNSDTTEIFIYDVIVDRQHEYNGKKYGVSPTSFLDELRDVDTQNICVRINSRGGEVFAAEAIRTAIREVRSEGKTITCKVDGFCGSAAVGISAACETTSIPASAWFMIHDPLFFQWGYCNIVSLQQDLDMLSKIKQGIVNAYAEKTGKDKKEIADLMTAETWFTGEEAVKNGFCDELMFKADEDEDDDSGDDPENAIFFDVSMYKNVPPALLNCVAPAAAVEHKPKNQTKQGGNPVEQPKNVAELKAQFPQLTEQIANEAAAAERQRVQDIENHALPGYEDLVSAAKADGKSTAADVAMQIVAAQKQQGATYLANVAADVAASGVGDVPPTQNDGTNKQTPKTEAEKLAQARADVKRVLGKTDEENK